MSDLLPNNATAQERAISEAVARLSDVPVPVRDVWNPDICPVNLLPWLAWAMSVDSWQDTWSELQKRQTIKASFAVHHRKGTIGAVRSGIVALGYGVEIVEWFNMIPEGDPYTFRADILTSTGQAVSLAQYSQLERIIEDAKNVRSHMIALRMTGEISSEFYVGSYIQSGIITDISSS